ncbi:MAG TPA: hypothetical protein VF338_09875 [Leptolinea sp.]
MNFFRKIARHPAAFPVFLLIVLLAAYGYQIQRMGFYWDDWQLVYLASLKAPQQFWGFYAFDRPLAAWLYVVLSPLLGINPVSWQIFAIVARWVGCLGFWMLFRQLWPQRYLEAGFATLILAIYPGFSQQPVSMTYSLFWVLFALFTWSLAASVYTLRKPKYQIILIVFAVLASFMESLSMEYVIGLELLRPLLFFILLLQLNIPRGQAIKRALSNWIPYFLILCIFVYYRFVYFPQINTDPEANTPLLLLEIFSQPLTAIPHLIQNIAQDLSQALVFAWGKPIIPAEIDFSQSINLFALIIGLGIAVIAVLLLRRSNPSDNEPAGQIDDRFTLQAVLIGLLGVILGGLPVWSTNRQIIVGMWSDRFSLSLMFGAAILYTGLTGWLSQKNTQRAIILSMFIALGVAFQVQNTARYKLNWDAQKDYYWQLAWRAPDIKPGTAVLGNKVPFGLSAEYSTGFALNTIYAPQENSKLPYWFFSAVSDRGGSILDYVDGIPLKFDLRTFHYDSSTSEGVAIYYKYGESCLRVMTREDSRYPNLTDSESELLAISHPNQIINSQNERILPAELFGSEPPHSWCYYFQKADLARQVKDWPNVLEIYRQANALGFSPKNGTENIPVIVALANTGSWEEAGSLTQKSLALTGGARKYFCDAWTGLRKLERGEVEYQIVNRDLNCEGN